MMNAADKKTVLITGASSGIGMEFAKVYAAMGYPLILVARREDRLRAFAKGLKVPCLVLPADLSKEAECYRIVEITRAQKVGTVINCAGFGLLGSSDSLELSEELEMINVNIKAMHILTKSFLVQMLAENDGTILNVASSAGLLPAGPYLSTYYATKSYVASFTRGIAQELKEQKSDVYVAALCPGPVNTEFTKVARGKDWSHGITPEACVAYAMKKMKHHKVVIVPGAKIRLGLFATRFLSGKAAIRIVGNGQKKKLLEKGSQAGEQEPKKVESQLAKPEEVLDEMLRNQPKGTSQTQVQDMVITEKSEKAEPVQDQVVTEIGAVTENINDIQTKPTAEPDSIAEQHAIESLQQEGTPLQETEKTTEAITAEEKPAEDKSAEAESEIDGKND